eukprot:TRINITY_DN79482_c0_g1_i1.p1 TRINITY_DN79482_c0_g1~~TRINITY_DN79482_c0_g1_i1.p1  ORF type:complete len:277 (+),score=5.46 TRINITY_DN79482_c0_g1_i1:133-963(+)
MFRFLAKDRSHRQRLELHKVIAPAVPTADVDVPEAMEEDLPFAAPMPRRKSVQIEELERPSHRRNHADNVSQAQGTDQSQGKDWNSLYAPHDGVTFRRSSLDCIRSAKRGLSAARPHMGADESSVEARSAAAMAEQRDSDSEDEVNSGGDIKPRSSRRHQSTRMAAQRSLEQQRNPFYYAMEEDVQQVPQRGMATVAPTSQVPKGWEAPRGGYPGSCGGMAPSPSPHGDRFCDMTGWGGMDQALHPAGLMQARAAMVAEGRTSAVGSRPVTFPDMM